VKALQELARGLPADLAASIFVVLHLLPWHKSELAAILSRSGPLPAVRPRQDEIIELGRSYVASPDRHLLIDKDHVQLWHGPKENRHRPAINPLFRSAVRGTYKIGQKTKEMLAEAHEQVNDIVAEVHAEGDVNQPASKATSTTASAS